MADISLQNKEISGNNERRDECFHHRAAPNRNGSYEDHVMAKSPLPSPEVLRQLLRYDPDTGNLFWRGRGPEWFVSGKQDRLHNQAIWNGKFAYKEAFTHEQKGYRVGRIFGQLHRAHRVIFAIMAGDWPCDQVDHINHNRSDNRWVNLRSVSNHENHQNMALRCDNSSGCAGVSWDQRRNLWRARIHVSGSDLHLGYFQTLDEAVSARRDAVLNYGYHENHGT